MCWTQSTGAKRFMNVTTRSTGFGNGHPECMWSCAAVIALAGQYYKRGPVIL